MCWCLCLPGAWKLTLNHRPAASCSPLLRNTRNVSFRHRLIKMNESNATLNNELSHLCCGLHSLSCSHGDGPGSGPGPRRQGAQVVGGQRLRGVDAVNVVGGGGRAVGAAACRWHTKWTHTLTLRSEQVKYRRRVWCWMFSPGVFSLEASDVSVDSRASDLNFFSGTCSVVWWVGALYFLSVTTQTCHPKPLPQCWTTVLVSGALNDHVNDIYSGNIKVIGRCSLD